MFLKKLLFAITFISIAIFIGVAGYLFFAKQQPALAQSSTSHYIRPNGGNYGLENGSDWNNAFDGIPATLVRGDTYYVAGGAYPGKYIFDDPVDGSKVITIKKANTAENSGVAGWDSFFENTQAVFKDTNDTSGYGRVWQISSSYYSFNGVTGSGTSGHGIKVMYNTLAPNNESFLIAEVGIVHDIIFEHIEVENAGAALSIYTGRNFNLAGYNKIIRYCYVHKSGILMQLQYTTNNILIENNYFKDNDREGVGHNEGFNLWDTEGGIIRYNIFENATNGTGGIMGGGDCGVSGTQSEDNWEIYGNIFFGRKSSGGDGGFGSKNSTATACAINNWKIFNNTFYKDFSRLYLVNGSGNQFINNLEYFNGGDRPNAGIFYSSNYYANVDPYYSPPQDNVQITNEDPFVDSLNGNFHLKAPTINGQNLPHPYNQDINGKVRGEDGVWDRGAIEYIATTPPLKGDFNSDSKVNDIDFTSFKNAFKSIFNAIFDLNSDNTIDVKDLGVLMSGWLE